MLQHTVEFIHTQPQLAALAERAAQARAVALDIETINWWDRAAEKVALVQLAFREAEHTHVAIIDTLANLELEPLRHPLELSSSTKAIHNASFDASRLLRHYRITTSPIHDTMLAARRSGDKKCSLKAQAETHLGLALDKTEQRGDWGRRPLSAEQLHYASLDAACTLLLYEQQCERGLRGDYELREQASLRQPLLPLPEPALIDQPFPANLVQPAIELDLETVSLALLGIIAELGGRYSPEHLAVSVGSERIGLAGWIIDRTLGAEADLDETSAKQAIGALCEQQLVRLSLTRRLEATTHGLQHWQARKT
ncbi:MAG: hypothetical protein HYR56_01345 [Acidobacteria bacterium]|nr:hypothetical protein [Acidobacteriota bacterium]MBI3423895.1 hypothetical protein [Acidobacteriota bacterium]